MRPQVLSTFQAVKYAFSPPGFTDKWFGWVGIVLIASLLAAGIGAYFAGIHWILMTVLPVILAILFLISTIRLIHPHTVIDRIRKSQGGSTVKDEKIKVSMLFKKHAEEISGIAFENCIFTGPCKMLIVGETTELVGNSFRDLELEGFIKGKNYYGAARFHDCKFHYCEFENLLIVTHKEVIKNLTEGIDT